MKCVMTLIWPHSRNDAESYLGSNVAYHYQNYHFIETVDNISVSVSSTNNAHWDTLVLPVKIHVCLALSFQLQLCGGEVWHPRLNYKQYADFGEPTIVFFHSLNSFLFNVYDALALLPRTLFDKFQRLRSGAQDQLNADKSIFSFSNL